MNGGGDPLADDEDLAFVSSLKQGDVVLHPQKLQWMRVVKIEDGVSTITTSGSGGDRETTEPWRRLYLMREDVHPLERAYARPEWLDYNDIEDRIRRKLPK